MEQIDTSTTFLKHELFSRELDLIADKVYFGMRITPAEGLLLYKNGELGFLGKLANFIREKKNGKKVFFNHNIHIEPTNICVFVCDFCSYSRLPKKDGWEKSILEMLDMVRAYNGKHITEVHIVGGVYPKMDLKFYAELFREIKKIRPEIHIKALTAIELEYIFRKHKISVQEGLLFLKQHGLDSIPGGGAEIFSPEIRNKICADKANAEQWLEIHETAHQVGLPSNATMLYGHIENYEHRIDHLEQLRNLQDKTNGFNCFIPLKFRNQNNEMSHIKEVSVVEDLRNYAICRIYLDNINHIKAYWPMIGKSTASLSLSFGVDDVDGTIDDSTKIYSMAGAEEQNPVMTTAEIIDLIAKAGKIPVERDSVYREIV